MTTIRLYRCNLCRDYIKPSDNASKEGFGLYFNGIGLTFKRVDETEHHICHSCARCVHDELRKVTPAP